MHRIVVIEDDPAIRRGLADNLRAESYEVATASDGEEGCRVVREHRPDLVILDLTLPRMNGYEVCRELRRQGMATPVLMLTAEGHEVSRVEGFDAGADDYVTKPFFLGELIGRVRAILRRSEGRPDLASQRELDGARRIQQRLMPSDIPQLPGIQIAGVYQPARIVGGDYFDVLRLDERSVALCIGDVCGKGVPAALIMANLQAAVKTCASTGLRPRALCDAVNRVMCDNLAEGFVTFFYAVLDGRTRSVAYCNAGHNPPILMTGHGSAARVRRLSTGGRVLGISPDWCFDEGAEALEAGDRLLLYTDGITEARNVAGEEFGDARLASALAYAPPQSAAACVTYVMTAATTFNGGLFDDDVTMVAVSME
jgi:sigma-B regulation protein RsbU (phosphoserine phosphatase)